MPPGCRRNRPLKGGRLSSSQATMRRPSGAELEGADDGFRLPGNEFRHRISGEAKQAATHSFIMRRYSEDARSASSKPYSAFWRNFHQNGLILRTGHNIQFGISAVAMKRAVAHNSHITSPGTRP